MIRIGRQSGGGGSLWELRFTCPMPPSSNDCYLHLANGAVVLKDKAREYLRTFTDTVIRTNPGLLREVGLVTFDLDKKYTIWMKVYFERIEKLRVKKGTSKWLDVDADRRIAVLQDGLKRFMGITDAAFFDIRIVKYVDALKPRVEVLIREFSDETEPF